MNDSLLYAFWLVMAGLLVAVPLSRRGSRPTGAQRRRPSRLMLLFLSIPLLIVLGAVVIHGRLRGLLPPGWASGLDVLFIYSALACVLGELRRRGIEPPGRVHRVLIRLPGQVFLAAAMLSTGWLLLMLPVRGLLWLLSAESVLDALRWADWVPLLAALASLGTSLRPRRLEVVRIPLAKDGPDGVVRVPAERHRGGEAPELAVRPLRLVQITDPHLGPWQPIAKLRRHIASLVAQEPDLVLLTGDYLTSETNGRHADLTEAFSPLQRLPGRCYACFGNHDHEAPETVRHALAANGVRLLVDEEDVAPTPSGPVQILGADFHRGKERAQRLEALLTDHPRREGHMRLLLLHDPSGFYDVPPGEADLTLSGHTHGGQVGLVSFGSDWTFLSRFRIPDHGLFAHGSNRLYVHRGTGFYGFTMRVGVPGEASVLEVVRADVGLEPPH